MMKTLRLVPFLLLLLFTALPLWAQTKTSELQAVSYNPPQPVAAVPMIAPSYEVMLQVLVGSDNPADKGNLPANLKAVSGQLRSDFSFANYRLHSTFVGRIGDAGTF